MEGRDFVRVPVLKGVGGRLNSNEDANVGGNGKGNKAAWAIEAEQRAEKDEPERILSRGGIGAMISGALVDVGGREGQRSKVV